MIELQLILPVVEKNTTAKLFAELPLELRPREYRLGEDERGRALKSSTDIIELFEKHKDGFLLYGNRIDYMLRIGASSPIICDVDMNIGCEFAIDFLERMVPAQPLFAYACQSEERNSRNRVVHAIDDGSIESWVGRDLEKYVPGLYWLTLLPSDLIAKHGIPIEALLQAAIEHRELEGGQHLFRFYEHPEDWRNTRKIDDLIAGNTGFFNIEKARQAVIGIKKIMPAIEALNVWM